MVWGRFSIYAFFIGEREREEWFGFNTFDTTAAEVAKDMYRVEQREQTVLGKLVSWLDVRASLCRLGIPTETELVT